MTVVIIDCSSTRCDDFVRNIEIDIKCIKITVILKQTS